MYVCERERGNICEKDNVIRSRKRTYLLRNACSAWGGTVVFSWPVTLCKVVRTSCSFSGTQDNQVLLFYLTVKKQKQNKIIIKTPIYKFLKTVVDIHVSLFSIGRYQKCVSVLVVQTRWWSYLKLNLNTSKMKGHLFNRVLSVLIPDCVLTLMPFGIRSNPCWSVLCWRATPGNYEQKLLLESQNIKLHSIIISARWFWKRWLAIVQLLCQWFSGFFWRVPLQKTKFKKVQN